MIELLSNRMVDGKAHQKGARVEASELDEKYLVNRKMAKKVEPKEEIPAPKAKAKPKAKK